MYIVYKIRQTFSKNELVKLYGPVACFIIYQTDIPSYPISDLSLPILYM